MLEIGSLLDGKYKILNEIGHGGMSTVYLALNERANKTWAVKEVRKEASANNEVLTQGLVAETEMLKKLNHPNLPSIIDVIDKDDSFIIVMDFIEGQDLQTILNNTRLQNSNGAQDPDTVIEWAKQLCDVLGYLHSRKPPIIYRDMKPANVMLKPNGDVCLIDFGTAREHKQNAIGDTVWLGTKGYAAPEQFGGQGETDARTDIYNLGATMYHLLTGYSPAETNFVILPVGDLKPSLSGSGIERVVSKCCQPDRKDRYQSCAELLYDLEHVHDLDWKVVRERNRKWYSFLAFVILFVVSGIAAGAFKMAENSTRASSYDGYIERAESMPSLKEAKSLYGEALGLDPGNIGAYQSMLKIATMDSVIDNDERILLENSLDTVSKGNNQSNVTYLQNRNPEDYARLMYDLGFDYFVMLDNGYNFAKNRLDKAVALEDGAYLTLFEKSIAESMSMLSEWYLADTAGNENVLLEDNTSSAWDNLTGLTGLASDPEVLREKFGNYTRSVFMYREMVKQIGSKAPSFRKSGISLNQITEVMNAAKQFFKNVDKFMTTDAERKLMDDCNAALSFTEFSVDDAYHEIGTEMD